MPVLTTSASAALAAADAQTIALPGETDTATLVKPTARTLLDLEIKDTDKLMAAQFRTHLRAKIVESLAGMCPGMGAEFIAITGGNTHVRHRRPAGLPRRIGPLTKGFRPRHRQSAPAQATTAGCDGCLHGALSSLKVDGPSRRFYDRKRGERLIHTQALLALASRLVDVLWALCAPDANSPSMLRLRSLPRLDTLIESPRQPR